MNTCNQCKKEIVNESNLTTGYGIDRAGYKICYDCCGVNDLGEMRVNGKITLYLNYTGNKFGLNAENYTLTNWPGTLKIKIRSIKKSYHNIASQRLDFWFVQDFKIWHGYTIGHNTQIAHCKVTKQSIPLNMRSVA